jgi:hypothetical protein
MEGYRPPENERDRYLQTAYGILRYIDESMLLRSQAALFGLPLRNVLGQQRSLMQNEEIIRIRWDVNRALQDIGGIITPIGEQMVTLIQWVGPDADTPHMEQWLGANPNHPGQFAQISLDPQSLRQEIAAQLPPSMQ